MIRDDFIKSGFPVCRRAPLICFVESGFAVAYNRYELRKILDTHQVSGCVGVWPGKYNTDVFRVDPEAYAKQIPPPLHAEIDSATEIAVYLGEDARVEYVPGPHEQDRTRVVERGSALLDYIKAAALQYKTYL